jgi:hypothetical protein
MPKGKRQSPNDKLADMIKKQIGHRTNPSTCSNCQSSSVSTDGKMICSFAKDFVIFEVSKQETCDKWTKKRKKREKKLDSDGKSVKKEKGQKKTKELKTQPQTQTQTQKK